MPKKRAKFLAVGLWKWGKGRNCGFSFNRSYMAAIGKALSGETPPYTKAGMAGREGLINEDHIERVQTVEAS